MKRLLVLGVLLVLVAPASGAAPRLLATEDFWPVWSPDGKTIAFTRVHPGRNLMELYVVDTSAHRIAKIAQSIGQLEPSWSPDGRSLAYQSGGEVWVAALDGSKRRIGRGGGPAYGPSLARVVAGDLVVDGVVWAKHVLGRPQWSPAGTKIAFRRDDGVYTAAVPGGGVLLVGGADPGDPAWSPDGTQLAFTLGNEIVVSGKGLDFVHAVATGRFDASQPAWTPDGTAVAYTWRGGLSQSTVNGRSMHLHDTAGVGASYSPAGVLAYSGPRPSCPGHLAIVVSGPVTGSCLVSGTRGADVIEGTPLWGDQIEAGAGSDQVHANDRHTDRVDCGSGRDTVWADRTDRLTSCEVVHR
jgi:hypothetical protein